MMSSCQIHAILQLVPFDSATLQMKIDYMANFYLILFRQRGMDTHYEEF